MINLSAFHIHALTFWFYGIVKSLHCDLIMLCIFFISAHGVTGLLNSSIDFETSTAGPICQATCYISASEIKRESQDLLMLYILFGC